MELCPRFLLMAVAISMFASTFGYSQEGGVKAPVVHKAREVVGRFEVDAFLYDVSLRNVYVEHPYAAHVTVGYHFLDWLSVELVGGYAFVSQESSIARQARNKSPNVPAGIELPGLWATTWQLGANVLFAPIYGKISLWSEFQNHFQIYAFLPLMGEGISRVVTGATTELASRVAFGIGAGARVFALDELTFRGELRQIFGVNPALAKGGFDVAPTTWLQIGVGYLF